MDTFGLCSYEDPVKALTEMQRVCKKGGRILLLEHGRSYMRVVSMLLNMCELAPFEVVDHCTFSQSV